jgi:hypothetical protein
MPSEPGEPDLPHIVRVTRFHYELGRLIHALTYGGLRGFDYYFGRTGIVVDEPDSRR